MKRYADLVAEALSRVREIMPWDLRERLARQPAPLVLDIREPDEFEAVRIDGSVNVPRGILEAACDWGYEETVPELVRARERAIVLVCRSGNRSALAADVMQQMGFVDVVSLRTGVRGWNDFDQPLVDGEGRSVDGDAGEQLLASRVREDQLGPS
ncbi:MAG: rhodanese-like domain-containing protein [Burkholderiales bacterium]|nr:MAG: rhodanese-like domain-containing protein [Burkholderiales bacterium]